MQGKVCLSSAGISNPRKRAAKGGANKRFMLNAYRTLIPSVETLYKSDPEGHLEVSCSLACSAGLSYIAPASWTAVGSWGSSEQGRRSILLSLHYQQSLSFLPISHSDPGSFPFHSPLTLPDLNSWQPLRFPVGEPSKSEFSHLCVLLFLFWTTGMFILFLSTAMSF